MSHILQTIFFSSARVVNFLGAIAVKKIVLFTMGALLLFNISFRVPPTFHFCVVPPSLSQEHQSSISYHSINEQTRE